MISVFRHIAIGTLALGMIALATSEANAQVRRTPRPTVPVSSDIRTIGEVDPATPIDIVVKNSLTVPLGIGFSGGANVELDPGEEVTVAFAAVPINLFLYPLVTEVTLSSAYTTTIDENTITVEVVEGDDVAPGDLSINIDLGGAVYVY
ncbi:MAG: hypothetical protein ACFCVD_23215 [Nodosilinea sp.]